MIAFLIVIASLKFWWNRFQPVLRDRFELQMEAFALRYQILVLQKSGLRPEFSPFDRFIWVMLARFWPGWQKGLEIIQPETVKRWNRLGWRVLITGKHWKNRGGRPLVEREIRHLIKRMAYENFLWGAPRIHGELLKLGFQVSEASVSRHLARYFPGRRYLTWRTFFKNQLAGLRSIAASTRLITPVSYFSGFLAECWRKLRNAPAFATNQRIVGTTVFTVHAPIILSNVATQDLQTIRIRGSPVMTTCYDITLLYISSPSFSKVPGGFVLPDFGLPYHSA